MARDVPGLDEAAHLGEQLTAHLSTCGLELAGRWVNVQASIGVAWAAAGRTDVDALIARADEAMYQAKRQRTGPLGLVVSPAQAAA